MPRLLVCWLIVLAISGAFARNLRAAEPAREKGVSAEDVRESIDRGVAYLKGRQNKVRGNWTEYRMWPGGVSALCTLALLNAGVDPEDETIQRSLKHLRSLGKPQMVYSTALQTMVFCAAEPKKDKILIQRNVDWLAAIQVDTGDKKGAWGYSSNQGGGDNSNTQFAILALYEAERAGAEVKDQTWRRALDYWLKEGHQKNDGAWGYFPGAPGRGTMTAAGIASVVIASGRVAHGNATVRGGRVLCCGEPDDEDAVEKGLRALGDDYAEFGFGRQDSLYYLYGIERVGRMTGRRYFFGRPDGRSRVKRYDWYREGAEFLVNTQDPLTGQWKGTGRVKGNPDVGTAFALLFLSKGRRPVVIAKLKHGPTGLTGPNRDWNRHRGDCAALTRRVEKLWKRDLTWHIIDGHAAEVEDLLQTPVLWISGSEPLVLNAEQKKRLRTYVDKGGFIFAENCCEPGKGFDRDFRKLMKELFPDSPLKSLPPSHPVWYAEQRVPADHLRPLLGIDACCRTSVVYCPKDTDPSTVWTESDDLSCYWELSGAGRNVAYGAAIQKKIDAATAIGANVLAYATGRELRDKLNPIEVEDDVEEELLRGTVSVVKLRHGGGSDDAPAALVNLMKVVGSQAKIRVSAKRQLVGITEENFNGHPIVFMHGRRAFRFTEPQRKALAEYLKRGGFLFADAICASDPFAQSFRREMQTIFPDARLSRIAADSPLFSRQYRGYDLRTVTLRDPQVRAKDDPLRARLTKVAPLLEGLDIDGRYAVVFSPYDISCAMENSPSLECKGYIRPDAARIGVNVLLYALQQ